MNLEQTISEPRRTFDLAIVVAAVESGRSIVRCLDAIDRDRKDRAVEVIVVGARKDNALERLIAKRSDTRLVFVDDGALTPQMWSEGIAQSSARVVALLTGHCFVIPGWSSALLTAVSHSAAAGGPLRLAHDASVVDAAIFFLRYSAYLDEGEVKSVRDIAGDNAAYVRERIPPDSWSPESGFWEHDVNRALIEGGEKIAWAGSAIAEFGSSFSFSSICRHRFEHGRLFGIARVERGERRMRIVAPFAAVPFVLAFRSWKRVSHVTRYRTMFVRSFPFMLLIALCWAVGEALGALRAGDAHRS